MSRRSLNKNSERKCSRDSHFYNGSGESAPKLAVSCSIRDRCKNDNGSRFLCSEFLFKFLLYILPLVLFFSYHPVISLGGNETMNFELSLPLIWLVLFDVVGVIMMMRRKILLRGLKGKWGWLLFPAWLTLSVIWSLNVTRGVLTVGILWLIYVAVYAMWSLRGLLDVRFWRVFWKWFFGSTLVVCGWCILQCILDLAGVGREYTLMCAGCTYRMFGFPHPNGFAIEPQFMGNLLLAPAIMAVWLYIAKKQNNKNLERKCSRDSHFYNGSGESAPKLAVSCSIRDRCKNDNGSRFLCSRFLLFCFFMISATLFLTFSRGAIYAFAVGMVFLSVFWLVREKKARKEAMRRVGVAWLVIVGAFVVALGVQGLMAELSPTNDTFGTGVAKVVNHLSLGIIDIRGGETEQSGNSPSEDVVEKSVENSEETGVVSAGEGMGLEGGTEKREEIKEEAVFDGYVAESTDTRMRLTGAAVEVWSQDFRTMMFGVGLGGAGQALYDNGLSPAPKEIVQNEYASLLLETGVVGVSLLVLMIVLAVRAARKSKLCVVVWALMLTYGVTLLFFSGLANALQIYLILGLLVGGLASGAKSRPSSA